MRRLLLWMAANRWLRSWLPRRWFAKRAVRRFMPGEDVGSALQAASGFQREGIGTLFSRLGENLTRIEEADAVAEHYLWLIDAIGEQGLEGEISVKLTQLGHDHDVDGPLATWRGSPSAPPRPARRSGSTWRGAPTRRPRSPSTGVGDAASYAGWQAR